MDLSLIFYILIYFIVFTCFLPDIIASSPSIIREIVNDPKKDISFTGNYSFDKTSIDITDIDKITYSSDGKFLYIFLLWDPSKVPHSLKGEIDFNYIIEVFLNLDVNHNKNTGFDHQFSYKFSSDNSNFPATNEYISDKNMIYGVPYYSRDVPYGFPFIFKNGVWFYQENEIVDTNEIQKDQRVYNIKNDTKFTDLTIRPNYMTISLNLSKINFPDNYSFLVKTTYEKGSSWLGQNLNKKIDYGNTVFDYGNELYVPTPEISISNHVRDFKPGSDEVVYLILNETNKYNLNTRTVLQDNSDNIFIDYGLVSDPNRILLNGIGNIPIRISTNPEAKLTNNIIPLFIEYSIRNSTPLFELKPGTFLGDNPKFSLYLPKQQVYNRTFYLNTNVNEREVPSLINLKDIPKEYIAIFIGALFTFLIPSAHRFINYLRYKHNASIHLDKINNYMNNENSLDLKQIKNRIQDDYISGRINTEQYQIVNVKISELLDKFNKKTN